MTGLSPSKTVFYLLPTKSNGGPCNARPEIWRGHGFTPLLTAFCAAEHCLSRKSVSHTTILPLKPWVKAPTKLGRFKGFLCYKVRGIFAFYLQRGCVVFIFIPCVYNLQWIFLHHCLQTMSLPASQVYLGTDAQLLGTSLAGDRMPLKVLNHYVNWI